jgi:group I intron endonuclease
MKNNNMNNNILRIDQQEKINSLIKNENYKYWLGGFTEGEGTLVVSIVKNDRVSSGISLHFFFAFLCILFFYYDIFWDYYSICFVVPIKIYSNAGSDKARILQENTGKAGIYLFTQRESSKKYVGSAKNLRTRFLQYFNPNHLERNKKMSICRALIKYKYENFSLEILEYCEVKDLMKREKHFIDLIIPCYNISLDPSAPMSGIKHSDETRKKMSDSENSGHFKPGKDHPMFGKNHSEETRKKLSDAKTGEKNPMFGKTGENHHNFGKPKAEGAGKLSQKIEVFDKDTNETTRYDSISAAARALNINQARISKYFFRNQQNLYKGRYTFKKL